MEFSFIENLGITIDLNVLKRESQPYSMLLYQHEGTLVGNDLFIGNSANVNPQFQAFLRMAKDKNSDLVLTPEYACPWLIIDQVLFDPNLYPADGKLWVLGCESISKPEMIAFQEKFNTGNIRVYFDEVVLQKDKDFLDPLVYIFRGKDQGQDKLVVLIQFKTHHMGVWGDHLERDHLIQGDKIYVLRNSNTSVHFFSLICSEAMNFQDYLTPSERDRVEWNDKPFLIYNPQCNPDPVHNKFINFRSFLLGFNRKELISLNWTNSSMYGQNPLMKYNFSRSGFNVKSIEVDITKQRIKHNHHLGMYYFALGQHKHSFVLNSSIHVFSIANQSVDIIGGVNEQQRKDGPQITEIFKLNQGKDELIKITTGASDSHIAYLIETGCSSTFLKSPLNCIIEKELLVSLSTGKIEKSNGSCWTGISNIYALKSDEHSEHNFRITFTEDRYLQNIEQRSRYIEAVSELENTILTTPDLLPDSIAELKNLNLKIGYHLDSNKDDYRYNVINAQNESIPATLCYMGHHPIEIINRAFDNIQGLFDIENNNRGRVVIFYKRGNIIHARSDPFAGSILRTNIHESPSIFKP
jgi:hypothetical protein